MTDMQHPPFPSAQELVSMSLSRLVALQDRLRRESAVVDAALTLRAALADDTETFIEELTG